MLGALANPRFLSVDNLTNVLARSTFIATIAVGQTLVITGGGLDLSVGAMAAFVSGLTILFLNSGLIDNMPLLIVSAMALSLAVGALCGLFNGLTTTLGKIEPFIVTLGTMGIFRSLLTWLAQGGSITIKNTDVRAAYRQVYFGDLFGVPYPVLVILGVAVIGAFILYGTAYGRHVRAVGSNEDVARYSGINVARVRTITYVLQGLCVAHRRHRLCAAAEFGELDDRARLGADGDHRRRRRRHAAQGRRRAHLGDDRRRAHSRSHRQHHAVVESGQRIPHRRGSGRDHHHRDAGAARPDARSMRKNRAAWAPARSFSRSGRGNMKRILVSLAVLGLVVGAAQAQEKKTMAVSIPTADHGWTGGVVFHAMEEAKALEKKYPGLKVIVKTSPDPRRAGERARGPDDAGHRRAGRAAARSRTC